MTELNKKRLSYWFFIFLGLGVLLLTLFGMVQGHEGLMMLLVFMWFLSIPIGAAVLFGTVAVTVFSVRLRERDWLLIIWSLISLLTVLYVLISLALPFGLLRDFSSLLKPLAISNEAWQALSLIYAAIGILNGTMGLSVALERVRLYIFLVVLVASVSSLLLYDFQRGAFVLPKRTTAESMALLRAAQSGDLTAVQRLLESGADIAARDEFGWDALFQAADRGHIPIVEFLLKEGADPDTKENKSGTRCANPPCTSGGFMLWGSPLIVKMASKGQADIVSLLIAHGADLYATDKDGLDAMTAAASRRQIEVIRILLENRMDPNLAGKKYPDSPLDRAAQRGHIQVVRMLLDGGADPNHRGVQNTTPIHSAAFGLHKEVIEALLNAGADPDPASVAGETPLMLAITGDHSMKVADKEQIRIEIIGLLLRAGADVNATDGPYKTPSEETPIIIAARRGRIGAIQMLLEAGARVDAQNSAGRTALMLACIDGYKDGVVLLLAAGADTDKVDIAGKTALDWAATKGHEDIVTLLSERSALE